MKRWNAKWRCKLLIFMGVGFIGPNIDSITNIQVLGELFAMKIGRIESLKRIPESKTSSCFIPI